MRPPAAYNKVSGTFYPITAVPHDRISAFPTALPTLTAVSESGGNIFVLLYFQNL